MGRCAARDIVEKLPKAADQCESTESKQLLIEAADAIERIRGELLEEFGDLAEVFLEEDHRH